MIFIDSGEYMTPAPDHKTVARFDLFGFEQIPDGRFDPENDDHVSSLGDWDYEADSSCEFPDFLYDDYNWLELLDTSVRDSSVRDSLARQDVLLVFADHDGPVIVLQ
jgi:hypothetical protein